MLYDRVWLVVSIDTVALDVLALPLLTALGARPRKMIDCSHLYGAIWILAFCVPEARHQQHLVKKEWHDHAQGCVEYVSPDQC